MFDLFKLCPQELVEKFGVTGVKVEELYGMDESIFNSYDGQLHGLLFLFKYDKGQSALGSGSSFSSGDDPTIFFASQVIQNACGTQALLHVLCNAEGVDKGELLENIKDFAAAVPADIRGSMLNSNSTLRDAHNSFARPDTFLDTGDDEDDPKSGEAFHFVAYVRVGNRVFEMDGLNRGPILLGRVPEGTNPSTWWRIAKPDIERRMQLYAEEELRFTLLGIVGDPREALAQDIRAAENGIRILKAAVAAGAGEAGLAAAREEAAKSFESGRTESESMASTSTTNVDAADSASGSGSGFGAGPLPSWLPHAPTTVLEAATGSSRVSFSLEAAEVSIRTGMSDVESMVSSLGQKLAEGTERLRNELDLREK